MRRRVWSSALAVFVAACSSAAPRRAGVDGPNESPDGAATDEASTPLDGGKNDARDAKVPGDEPPRLEMGASDRFLLLGTVLAPAGPIADGEVLVEANVITCVGVAGACRGLPAASGATLIDTKGVVMPGLIDTHNHILFDVFDDDDWLPERKYANHEEWTNEARYQAMLDVKQCLANDAAGKPAWCAQTPYGTSAGSLRCEMNKWGELKGLVAGTTSIVGLPGTSANCFSSLARSVDVPQSGLPTDGVQTSAIFPPSSPNTVCTNFASGKTHAFLVHVGEGLDQKSRDEFLELGSMTSPPNCLYAPQTAITHGTSFTASELGVMGDAGMKLIWSPRSNVALYGTTTDIPMAMAAGVKIALAPDWSMGGSQNLLDELRFADDWDDAHWGNVLDAEKLVDMTTKTAALALGLEGKIGALAPQAFADITVVRGDRTRPFEAVVQARPRDVRLVMVGGTVLYGDAVLQAAAPTQPGCETVDICGASKFLCVATSSSAAKLDQTSVQIHDALEAALREADTLTPDAWSFAPLAPLVRCDP